MTSARPLFFVVLIVCVATSAFAAGDGSESQAPASSLENQTANTLFAQPAGSPPYNSDLFFLKSRPRLNLSPPAVRPQSAVLNENTCFTMRMYKVKRKERFTDGENGSRGYTTCELASNYQMRSAIAHVQTLEDGDSQDVDSRNNDSRDNEPRK